MTRLNTWSTAAKWSRRSRGQGSKLKKHGGLVVYYDCSLIHALFPQQASSLCVNLPARKILLKSLYYWNKNLSCYSQYFYTTSLDYLSVKSVPCSEKQSVITWLWRPHQLYWTLLPLLSCFCCLAPDLLTEHIFLRHNRPFILCVKKL